DHSSQGTMRQLVQQGLHRETGVGELGAQDVDLSGRSLGDEPATGIGRRLLQGSTISRFRRDETNLQVRIYGLVQLLEKLDLKGVGSTLAILQPLVQVLDDRGSRGIRIRLQESHQSRITLDLWLPPLPERALLRRRGLTVFLDG